MENYNQHEFTNYTVVDSQQATGTGTVAKKYMASVFAWMFVALGVSTFFAWLFGTSEALTSQLYNVTASGGRVPTGLGWIVTFAPIGFVLLMGMGFRRLSASALTLLFLVFATIMGISLSYILWVYSSGSVIGCFSAASLMFGAMAVMGYTTQKDLTSFGQIMTMGLIGILIAMVVNMFIGSAAISYIISLVGVAVFTGLTAYDVQKLKRIGAGVEYEGVSASDTRKLAILGALDLYLDFINLFIMLLRLFGGRKD